MTKKAHKLKELVKVIPGMAFRLSDADENGTIPVVNASHIIANETLADFGDAEKITELPKRSPAIIENNDILLVSRSAPGTPFKASLAQTTDPIVATSSLYILKIKNENVDPSYLNYFINSDVFQRQLALHARGSTIKLISKQNLEDIEIPLPDKKKQQAIIDLTNNIKQQTKIHQRKQQLKQQILQSTFTNISHQ